MSEYFLADHKAEERARQRQEPQQSRDIKVTLLGDFMFPSVESTGCDPYNNTQGKAERDAWLIARRRR